MSDTQIVPQAAQSLLLGNGENEIKNMTRKIMKLTPGGQRLSAEQAVELAVFSYVNALNPFNGEAYYLPGAGPTPGVMAYRNRAQNELEAQGGPTARFWFDFIPLEVGEADYDPDAGDIGYRAVLHESVAEEAYQRRLLEFFIALQKEGIKDAYEQAKQIVGPAPTWEAVGVVSGKEVFTKGDKPDKWDRHERAKKRAEKWAIKKRFSRITFPDAELGERLMVDTDFVEGIVAELEQPREPRDPEDIIAELGFEVTKTRQWPTDLLTRIVNDGHANHPKHAINILEKSPFADELDLDYSEVLEWVKHRKDEPAD